jgi:hypothetical protein
MDLRNVGILGYYFTLKIKADRPPKRWYLRILLTLKMKLTWTSEKLVSYDTSS